MRNGQVSLLLLEPRDWSQAWEILRQPGVLEWITPVAAEVTEQNCLQKLGLLADPTAKLFGIWVDGKLVGVEALAQIDWQNRSAVIPMIAVGEHGYRHGVQATRLLVEWAFDTLNLHRISYTSVHPKARARATLLGAEFEGTHRGAIWKHGQWLDRHCFAFLRKE